jgi:hypothetical protein
LGELVVFAAVFAAVLGETRFQHTDRSSKHIKIRLGRYGSCRCRSPDVKPSVDRI